MMPGYRGMPQPSPSVTPALSDQSQNDVKPAIQAAALTGYSGKRDENATCNENRFLPEASFGLRVLSFPASACVCPCVRQTTACPRDNS